MKGLIPFYTYKEKERLGYTLYIHIESGNVYRVYEENRNIVLSGQYFLYYFPVYWILNALKGSQLSYEPIFMVVLLMIITMTSFYFGYSFLINKLLDRANMKEAFLTKEEFINYAKEGKKSFKILVLLWAITMFILILTIYYYFVSYSILSLIFISFLTFIAGASMRSIPMKRIKLHFNEQYRNEVAHKIEGDYSRDDYSM